MTLAEIAGNRELVRVMQMQSDKHALEQGDADGAEREMTAHLERGKEFLRQSLAAAA